MEDQEVRQGGWDPKMIFREEQVEEEHTSAEWERLLLRAEAARAAL